jgi:hypothetical protein
MKTSSSLPVASPSSSPLQLMPSDAATSSAPTTPTQERMPAIGHGEELRSRVPGHTGGAADMPRRAGLQQIAAAVGNASVTQAVVGALQDAVAPASSLMADTARVLSRAAQQASRPALSSQPLQAALRGDLANAEGQLNAHREAIEYGQHSAQMLDRVLPFAHGVLRIGLAGTAMTLGLGRSAGTAAGDTLGRIHRGAPVSQGFLAGAQAPARPLSSAAVLQSAATGFQQWLLGSAGCGVGNLAGQLLVAPLVGMIPRQFHAIDARAVVPNKVVDLMNTLKPGAGNELRDQVKAAQTEIANLTSPSNVLLGQISFDSAMATRFAALGATPLGIAGQVGAGVGVSATAGALIGAVMALRQAVSTIEVPDAAALQQAVDRAPADGPAALAQVRSNAVPLFFARHTSPNVPTSEAPRDIETGGAITAPDTAQAARASSISGAVSRTISMIGEFAKAAGDGVAAAGTAVKQGFLMSPLLEPLPSTTPHAQGEGRVLATTSNVLASGVRRAVLLAKATAPTSAMATASAMLAGATEGVARRAVLAIGNAVGIHAAIQPGFDALARGIPAGDNAMRARRQELVNTKASARPPV